MKKRAAFPSLVRRFLGTKKHEPVVRDGKMMHVIRPVDPELALRLTKALVGKTTAEGAEEDFNDILDAQPYTYEGLMGREQQVLHPETHEPLGPFLDGDSFVTFPVPFGLRPGDPFPNSYAGGWRPDVLAVEAREGEEASAVAARAGDPEPPDRIEIFVQRQGDGEDDWTFIVNVRSAPCTSAELPLPDLRDVMAIRLVRVGTDAVRRYYEFFVRDKTAPLLRDDAAQLRMLLEILCAPIDGHRSEPIGTRPSPHGG